MDTTTGRRPARVALYGHDTCGLGHLRRNLALAGAMAAEPDAPDVLVITGAAEAGRFPRPRGVDLLVLPSVVKRGDGSYAPGSWGGALDDVVRMRSAVLEAALLGWAPELLVVDKVPLGFAGELRPALAHLARGRTRLVLGLREVLDDPVVARREWREAHATDVVRELYDEVWVYGDPSVHDLADDLALPPAVRRRTRYLGYLANGRADACGRPTGLPADREYVLGLVGGGVDGGRLASAFAAAPLPRGTTGVLLTGPYMPDHHRAEVERLATSRDDVLVVPFSDNASGWISGARAVLTMGGYNSVAEVLATDTPALVVPRTTPRLEQAVRAESLSAVGALDVLDPAVADAAALGAWTADAVTRRVDRSHLDLDGLAAVAARAGELLAGHPARGVALPSRGPALAARAASLTSRGAARPHLEVARAAV